MEGTGFWWIILAMALYGVLHSVLASMTVKSLVGRVVGEGVVRRFYRLFFSINGGLTFLIVLFLVAALPNRTIYTFPGPWLLLAMAVQLLAVGGLIYGVLQTGLGAFIGLTQLARPEMGEHPGMIDKGLYGWVRHPLYTLTILFIWLTPLMSWNTLALNIGVTVYMVIGSLFEERKLLDAFGEEYAAYRRRTPMLIPGLKQRRRSQ